jgi:hypothetical protein
MEVYVVVAGENGEGGSIVDIYSTQKRAMKEAEKRAKRKSKEFTQHLGTRWKLKNPRLGMWTYGCDFVLVEKRTVIE